jgi:hypothetical protein
MYMLGFSIFMYFNVLVFNSKFILSNTVDRLCDLWDNIVSGAEDDSQNDLEILFEYSYDIGSLTYYIFLRISCL